MHKLGAHGNFFLYYAIKKSGSPEVRKSSKLVDLYGEGTFFVNRPVLESIGHLLMLLIGSIVIKVIKARATAIQ